MVAGVHIRGVTKVNGAGAVMTYKEGPSGLRQGIELITLPPNEIPSADAGVGSKNAPIIMNAAGIKRSMRMFSLYTESTWAPADISPQRSLWLLSAPCWLRAARLQR